MTHVGNLCIPAQSAEFALNGDSQSRSGTPRRRGAAQEVLHFCGGYSDRVKPLNASKCIVSQCTSNGKETLVKGSH